MSVQLAPSGDVDVAPQAAQAISRTIAEFAENLHYGDLSPRLRDFTRYHILVTEIDQRDLFSGNRGNNT